MEHFQETMKMKVVVSQQLHLVPFHGEEHLNTQQQPQPSKQALSLSEVRAAKKLEAVLTEAFLETMQMKAVVSSSLQDTQAVIPTISQFEATPLQPVMSGQASLEPRVPAMDVCSSGEKTLPGLQARELHLTITVHGIEIRSLAALQESQVGLRASQIPPF
jgi:hypothetical protein